MKLEKLSGEAAFESSFHHDSLPRFRLHAAVKAAINNKLWLRRLDCRRWRLPRVVLQSLPKSGTHLLARCVSLLPGMSGSGLWIPPLRTPSSEALGRVDWILAISRPGQFTTSHAVHPDLERTLSRRGFKSIQIRRDPRDVVVSRMNFALAWKDHAFHRQVAEAMRTDEERLLFFIGGGAPSGPSGIADALQSHRPRDESDSNLIVRFERLVGPQGGGDLASQLGEIARIARHLGFALSDAEIEKIGRRTFWKDSATFHEGCRGSWRGRFNERVKDAFKKAAGRQLVEMGYERDLDW